MLQLIHHIRLSSMQLPRRSMSTLLIHPDKVFAKTPPFPPSWPEYPSPLSDQIPSALQWSKANITQKHIQRCLRLLEHRLRCLHKRKIEWQPEEPIDSNLTPNEYLSILLRPIVDIFNQLRGPDVLNRPIEYKSINFSQSIIGGYFIADDFKKDKKTSPIIISLPDAIFDATGQPSSPVEAAVAKALKYQPSTPSIIVSNFAQDIAVFWPPWEKPEPVFEHISTTQPPLALRVIASACLFRELDEFPSYIPVPEFDIEPDMNLIGPPNNPHAPLLADEDILQTHLRHSDFDFVTLVRDRERALQFFRWHDRLRERYSKVVAHTNDVLAARTNEFGVDVPDAAPLYPYDASELPADTVAHLREIQRKSPLEIAGIEDALQRSTAFTIKIENLITGGSEGGICTVYRCHLTSIDSHPVSSPTLCLKLFDDRFQNLKLPNKDDLLFQDQYIHKWFEPLVVAEAHALNEAFAYNKLRPVQGTVIPWFYGMHQFTLPDGSFLYGLLMEYIEGGDLQSQRGKSLSPTRQINLIHSCRHAVRVLDAADINQHDWHGGQILLYMNPNTHIDHVVLVDLASTTQTWDIGTPNRLENYFQAFSIMLDRPEENPFDWDLVWEHLGRPEDWDTLYAFMRRYSDDDQSYVSISAGEMFPYISCVTDESRTSCLMRNNLVPAS